MEEGEIEVPTKTTIDEETLLDTLVVLVGVTSLVGYSRELAATFHTSGAFYYDDNVGMAMSRAIHGPSKRTRVEFHMREARTRLDKIRKLQKKHNLTPLVSSNVDIDRIIQNTAVDAPFSSVEKPLVTPSGDTKPFPSSLTPDQGNTKSTVADSVSYPYPLSMDTVPEGINETNALSLVKDLSLITQYRKEREHHIRRMEWYLRHGADPNFVLNSKWTYTTLCAYHGDYDVMKVLLQYKALPDAVEGVSRSTPLILASQNPYLNIIDLLLETKKVNVHARNTSNGTSPILFASQENQFLIVEKLLQAGAKVNDALDNGVTVLDLAISNKRPQVVDVLVRYNVDPNIRSNTDKATPLIASCQFDQSSIACKLIEAGADINATMRNGWNALHLAAVHGLNDVVDLLIRKGVDINALEKESMSNAIILATQKGFARITEALIAAGIDIHVTNNRNNTNALLMASQEGFTDCVRALLAAGARVDSVLANGLSSLHLACTHGRMGVIKLLLEYDAPVNLCSNDGSTPIGLAAQDSKEEIVRLLLEKQANVNLSKNKNWTPLLLAATKDNINIVRMLLDAGADVNALEHDSYSSPLIMSCQRGYTNIAELLLERGANPNIRNTSNGTTAIALATQEGKLDCVRLLADYGVNVSTALDNGLSCLVLALRNNHRDIALELLNRGCDVRIPKPGVDNPLVLAMEKQYEDIVQIMCERGTNVNIGKIKNWTPLLLTASAPKDDVERVRLLLDHGADITQREEDSDSTAAILAAKQGNIKILQLLIERGVDLLHRNNINGTTAIVIAAQENKVDCVRLLLDNGIDVNTSLNNCMTSLHLASRAGHTEMVELLLARGADATIANNSGATARKLAETANKSTIAHILRRHEQRTNGSSGKGGSS